MSPPPPASTSLLEKAYAERHVKCREMRARGRRFLGVMCTYVPEELILAAGATPVRVTPLLGGAPMADAHLPINACPAMKASLEAALRGVYDYLDGVVFSNSCDNMGRVYDIWKLLGAGGSLFFFNTPHSKHSVAVKRFIHESLRLKSFLESLYARSISDDEVKAAAVLMNRLRSALMELEGLRAQDPPLLTGVESFYAVAVSMSLPREEALELVEGVIKDPPRGRGELKGRPRILVSGSYIDDEARLLRLIEDAGGCVVAEDTCMGLRYYDKLVEPSGDIYEALAARYLEKVPCPFVEHYEGRLRAIKEAVGRFNVQGVVAWIVKFCDIHLFEAPLLVEELRGMGVPCMVLEWSPMEVEWARLKTRVEAFVESLGGI
ncbi:MAG: 2-hydroxyacyl-CoA dehydratase family protein [Candidatus Nezhaarchaeota archaeon]|nr:2-hydroxyacyl-CoA dehydratase family protein [Candidatus Nezhaarchaeota archaeon]